MALKSLGDDIGLKIARAATGSAAQPIKKRAKQIIEANPSVDTGALLNSVVVKRLDRKDTTLTSEHIVTVRGRGKRMKDGTRSQGAPHASFVEFGTVNMPAEPYLRPAFEQEKGAALDAMVKRLKARIDKANQGGK